MSGYFAVTALIAAPTVAASTSISDCRSVNDRSAEGIKTVTIKSPPKHVFFLAASGKV
jgi:hypothetical protein